MSRSPASWSGRRRGATFLELLVSVLLLTMASSAAIAAWSISARAPSAKRATEMGVYIATRHIESLKAQKYSGVYDTGSSTPAVTYYDSRGTPAMGAVARGYKVKCWITPVLNRDALSNTEDLREIRVEVWNNSEAIRYETSQAVITFGGL